MLIILISLTVLLVAAGSGFLLWRRSRRRKLFRKLEPDLFRSSRYELKSIDQFLYDRCCRYMTEKKPFLVCSFTLGDLASALYSNKVYLSKTIKILCYFLIVCVIIYSKLKSNDYLSMT